MKSRKKLYWHFPHLLYWMGGTKFLHEVLKRLQREYDVALVTPLGKEEVIEHFTKDGITVHTYGRFSTNSLLYWLFFPFFLCYDCFASFRYFAKADVIVVTAYPSNLIASIYKILSNKPFHYYCYEPFAFFHNPAFIGSFPLLKRLLIQRLAFFYGWTDKWASRMARVTFTLNQITEKMNKEVYGIESVITLMGVDSELFKPYVKNKIANTYKDRILITHSTDYTFMKRTDLAIEAVSHVVKKYSNILLIITSTQPNSPEKQQYIDQVKRLKLKKNILFLGLVPFEDLPLYYAASRCYVSCSYDEMFGTTSSNLPVKEALAAGTPAIRANITTEDVEDGVSGFLVDPRNSLLVAEKIEFLIANSDKAKKMGLNGRTKIKKIYTWDAVTTVISNNLHSQ